MRDCQFPPIIGLCDDHNPCTINDSCATGSCRGIPTSGNPCDDFSCLTINDTCVNGTCQGTPSGGIPLVFVSLTPDTLHPPNRRRVEILASVVAQDCGTTVPVVLSSIVSSEPDDAPGAGDGNTRGDIRDADFGTADFRFRVRSERDGQGPGRTYVVTYTAAGVSGATGVGTASIFVPIGGCLSRPDPDPGAGNQGKPGKGTPGK